jgi:hypothetical protein
MKKLTLVLLSLAAASAFADCVTPQTPQESLKCMADSFNTRKTTIISNANEVYQYNYNIGYSSLSNKVSSWNRVISAPYYATKYATTVVPAIKTIITTIKNRQFSDLPANYATYQTARRALFTGKSANFATYITKELEQLIGSVEKISGNTAKAHAYAQINYVGYLAPAIVYNVYDFATTDASKYINSTVTTMTQAQCETSVSGFQGQFNQLMVNNGTVKMIADQFKPDSLVRDLTPVIAGDTYSSYITGGMDIIYAFGEGKAISGSNVVSYNVCDYSAFQTSVAKGTNPSLTALNTAVQQLASKTGYPVQNVYWLMAGFVSEGMYQAMQNVTINAGSGQLFQ